LRLALEKSGVDHGLVQLENHVSMERHSVAPLSVGVCSRFIRDKIQHLFYFFPREAVATKEYVRKRGRNTYYFSMERSVLNSMSLTFSEYLSSWSSSSD